MATPFARLMLLAAVCVSAQAQAPAGLDAPTVPETMPAAKAAPTVTFTGAPASAVYQTIFTVVATSNSGVTPTITATGSCSISGTTVTMTSGTGKWTMKAPWAATDSYL